MKLKCWTVTFFYILKFLCLMPFTLNSDTMKLKRSKFSEFLSIIFCIFLILIDRYITENLLSIKSIGYDFRNFTFVDFVNNGAYLLMLICVIWTIYTTKQTLMIFEKIDFILESLNKSNLRFNSRYEKSFSIFIKITIAFQAVPIISHYIFQVVQDEAVTSNGLFYLTIIAIKYFIGSLVVIQMNAILLSIRCILSMIGQIIKEISLQKNKEQQNCRVCELSEIYRIICEIKKLFSKRFSIPIIAIIVYCLGVLIAQYFQTFKALMVFSKHREDKDILSAVCLFAWPTFRLFVLIQLFYYVTKTMKEVCSCVWFIKAL